MLNPAHISSIMLPMADRGCRGAELCGASVFSAERAIIRTDVLTILRYSHLPRQPFIVVSGWVCKMKMENIFAV